MGTNSIDNASNTTLTATENFEIEVDSQVQDEPGNTYSCDWSKWWGYYTTIPELQAVINKKAIWSVGKGFKADEKTAKILGKIKGNGKDTFNSIIYNLICQYTIGGDGYAEIIRNKRGELINIKPLSPGTMEIESGRNGMIKGYNQILYDGKTISFKPEEIFHLSWNRIGDECHGRSTIEKIERIILMRNEAMEDMKIVFHRYVSPLCVWELDTDNSTEIASFKTKITTTYKDKEVLVIPKDSAKLERYGIPQYSTLDPLPWIHTLNQYFIMAEGVPEVILGYGRDTTEASSKILYLAFQQVIEQNQLFLEEQIKAQLGLDVEFEFPESLGSDLTGDNSKDGNNAFSKEDSGVKL